MSTTKLLVWWTLGLTFRHNQDEKYCAGFYQHCTGTYPTYHRLFPFQLLMEAKGYLKANTKCKLTFSHWTSTCNYQPYNPTDHDWTRISYLSENPRCVGLNSIDLFFSPNNAGQWKDVCPSFSFPPRSLVCFFRFFLSSSSFFPKEHPETFPGKTSCWNRQVLDPELFCHLGRLMAPIGEVCWWLVFLKHISVKQANLTNPFGDDEEVVGNIWKNNI